MRVLLIAGLLAANLSAADLNGTWIGELPPQGNRMRLHITTQIAFQFIQNDATLTGKLYGDYESSPITEGKVNGDTVDFVVVTQEQQGNQINRSRLHFTGTIQPDGSVELARVRERSTNAGDGGDYKNKTNTPKQTFVIKRL
jgi:hypothetical protein